jgi:hypothetical protein
VTIPGSSATCGSGGALGGTRTPSLLIRRDQLDFAGFPTCADLRDIASSGFRILDFPGFPLADPLAACGSCRDLPEPGSRLSGVNGSRARSPTVTYRAWRFARYPPVLIRRPGPQHKARHITGIRVLSRCRGSWPPVVLGGGATIRGWARLPRRPAWVTSRGVV